LLILCIIAIVCVVESIENTAFFGITHIKRPKQYLVLPHGITSADTILRVLGRIDHKKFEECFLTKQAGTFGNGYNRVRL
jgi:hypothetical protein